jgi:hypothetical protein
MTATGAGSQREEIDLRAAIIAAPDLDYAGRELLART